MKRLSELFTATDVDSAIKLLLASEPLEAAEMFQKLQAELYWKSKNLPAVVMLSQEGIRCCMAAAENSTGDDAEKLFKAAKRLALNLASFCWPGWDEPGVHVSKAQMKAGLAAAKVHVELVKKLGRPERASANALWILGAQFLAAGEFASAKAAFHEAHLHAVAAEDLALQQMLEAYAVLARLLPDGKDPELLIQFEKSLSKLKAIASEDADEYARQLPIALATLKTAVP